MTGGFCGVTLCTGRMIRRNMINVTIVEDSADAAKALAENIERYGKENACEFDITVCPTAAKFLSADVAGGAL